MLIPLGGWSMFRSWYRAGEVGEGYGFLVGEKNRFITSKCRYESYECINAYKSK